MTIMSEFLLELFSEEIPARFQKPAAEDLKRLFTEKLATQNLSYSAIEAHVTPRRLALMVDGLPLEQPARREEKKGPKVDAPQAAIDGFLKSAGLTSLEQCEARDTPKGNVWFAYAEIPGRKTAEVLANLIQQVVREMPWPKSMNWGEGSFRWVRPLHSIIALFDGEVLKGEFELGNEQPSLVFGNETEGHRFMGKGRFAVQNFADYKAKLLENFVVLDRAERKQRVKDGAIKALAAKGATFTEDEGLLEEVTGLVEWPVSLVCQIDSIFMDIPPEVLTTTMRNNQKYFVSTVDGKFSPYFVVTSNRETNEPGIIIGGNERVLRARLSDARFFWDLDRKTKLAEFATELGKVTFHAKLGTLAAKVERMQKLAEFTAPFVLANAATANEAAKLAKADLVTNMVGEFPELQGVMGGYYARHEKLNEDIIAAIGDHYSPVGPNDRCPSRPVSIAVALADKLDTLVGFFGIEEFPTGSKDPYALRRAALGVIRLIVENKLRLDLNQLIATAHSSYASNLLKPVDFVLSHLGSFFIERLKASLKDKGVRHDLVTAVFATKDHSFDITARLARLEALQSTLTEADGTALVGLYRRAANILRIEEKKDERSFAGAPNWLLFKADAPDEKKLAEALAASAPEVDRHLMAEDYPAAMKELVKLRPVLDAFFANVTVNDADSAVRENRLYLLAQIRSIFDRIADFSQIEGE